MVLHRRATPLLLLAILPMCSGERYVQLTQRERLKELIGSLRHTHGGPSFVERSSLERLSTDAYRECQPSTTEEEYTQLCHRVIAGLEDQYAAYLPEAQSTAMRERFHGRVGLGISLRRDLRRADGQSWHRGWRRVAAVTAVEDHSPAARAGVLVGDELLKVDSLQTRDAELPTVSQWLEGPEGSQVQLLVRRQGQACDPPTSLCVSRRLLPRPSVSGSPASLGDMGTAYVLRVGLFGASTASELRVLLQQLSHHPTPPRALVIDLRDNDGGLLTAAVSSARMLLPAGSHLLSLQKSAPPRTLRAFRRRWYHRSALPPALRARDAPPILVLVNERTASAAEVLAAALRHSGRAVLVGGRTFGKGMSQALVYQRDGAALLFTVYQLASGARRATDLLTRGVEPDLQWSWRNRASDAGTPRARAEDRELSAAISYALRCHEEKSPLLALRTAS